MTLRDAGKEIVFYAHDIGKQTVRDLELTTPFARAMSVPEAMNPKNLLCYEMNGESLPAEDGSTRPAFSTGLGRLLEEILRRPPVE